MSAADCGLRTVWVRYATHLPQTPSEIFNQLNDLCITHSVHNTPQWYSGHTRHQQKRTLCITDPINRPRGWNLSMPFNKVHCSSLVAMGSINSTGDAFLHTKATKFQIKVEWQSCDGSWHNCIGTVKVGSNSLEDHVCRYSNRLRYPKPGVLQNALHANVEPGHRLF